MNQAQALKRKEAEEQNALTVVRGKVEDLKRCRVEKEEELWRTWEELIESRTAKFLLRGSEYPLFS